MKIKCDITVRNFKTVELEIPDNIDLMNKYEKQKYFSEQLGLTDDQDLVYVESVDDEEALLDM